MQLFATPQTVAHQAPLSMGFSRQKYWGGLPFPTPGDLSNPGIKPMSLTSPALSGRFFTISATWEAHFRVSHYTVTIKLQKSCFPPSSPSTFFGASGGSAVKNPPAMHEPQETGVRSPSWEDPLLAGVEIHPSIFAWRIPWIKEPGGLH